MAVCVKMNPSSVGKVLDIAKVQMSVGAIQGDVAFASGVSYVSILQAKY